MEMFGLGVKGLPSLPGRCSLAALPPLLLCVLSVTRLSQHRAPAGPAADKSSRGSQTAAAQAAPLQLANMTLLVSTCPARGLVTPSLRNGPAVVALVRWTRLGRTFLPRKREISRNSCEPWLESSPWLVQRCDKGYDQVVIMVGRERTCSYIMSDVSVANDILSTGIDVAVTSRFDRARWSSARRK